MLARAATDNAITSATIQRARDILQESRQWSESYQSTIETWIIDYLKGNASSLAISSTIMVIALIVIKLF